MRLKEISIQRYGPLTPLTLRLGKGVQPIYGPNESGKTLLIDALLKMLTGLGTGWHKFLDRVEETPEGYIVLEDDGKEIKLEKGETLADYLNIEPDELRNIFVIRDADLRIDEESVFYEKVTDRIAGLRAEDIRKIKRELREQGRLTSGNRISDAQDHYKAKSQLRDARKLMDDIVQYLKIAEEKGFRDLEADIFEAKFQSRKLKELVDVLEKAKKKKEFHNLEEILNSARLIASELEKMHEEKFSSLKTRLTLLEDRESEIPSLERSEPLYRKLSYIGLAGSVASFIFILAQRPTNLLNFLFPFALLFFSIFSLLSWHNVGHKISAFERNRISLIREGQRLGLKVNSIQDLRRILGDLEQKHKEFEGKLHEKLGVLKNAFDISSETIEDVLEKATENLVKMKEEVDLDLDVEFNEAELKRARKHLSEIDSKLKRLTEELEEHQRALNEFLRRAHQLNFRVFVGNDLELNIENLESLKDLTRYLEEFINQIEDNARLSIEALAIFEKLESEEEAKITELFREESLASQIFAEITKERYREVKYDPETAQIFVRRPSGEMLSVDKLSKGARDQLYLAIRVALGRKLLEGRSGFFVMDDAFIASDKNRLKLQLNIIEQLSKMGWQTLYFTAKEEIIDALCKISGNKPIKLKQLT